MAEDLLDALPGQLRGRDLLLSSPQQMYVADLLGISSPRFCHLPLLCNREGQRLSKRDQSLDMENLRHRYTASQIVGELACLAGLIPTPDAISAKELLPVFSWEKVPKEDIVVGCW